MTTPIRGSRAIEAAAIAWVLDLERLAGRAPVDTRHQGAPADVESPPRTIEVKAYGQSARGNDLWLEVRQVEEAERNEHFYVYVVENVAQGDRSAFTQRVPGGRQLQTLLARKREQRYFTVPWPVGHYDATPLGL